MKIKYASEHKWVEEVTEDAVSGLGKNNRSRLTSTLNKVSETNVTHSVQPLTPEILSWFQPLYESTIANKSNPKLFDIHGTTLGRETSCKYFALCLYEGGKPIGATIFSERKLILSVAYRIFPNNWSTDELKASPSLYSEYLLNKYAWDRGYKKISHGKDRNPYGVNSSIGLAMFKLSVGCRAYLPTTPFEVRESKLSEFDSDIFILKHPEESNQINDAVLYILAENLPRFSQLQKYSDRLRVEVVIRPKE